MLSLHRVYTELFKVYTESTQSYTESTQSNSEPKRLYKANAGSTHSVMQYYKSKPSKFDQIHWWILFTFPNNVNFYLSFYPFNHHPQQFTSKDVPPSHLSSSSTIHFSTTLRLQLVSYLEVMRPAFSHWAALPVHIKSWKVLYLIAGFVIQKLELLIQ